MDAIPNTLRLTFSVLIFQYIVGILLGILCALKQKSKLDTLINRNCYSFMPCQAVNVLELQNAIARASLLEVNEWIGIEHLDIDL